MSGRNPTIPFGNFYHPPMNLPEIMERHGCANATDLNVMNALFSLVQFHKTERVGEYDLFIGDTCIVSHSGLAARCFFNERTIRRSIERLKEAGLIVQHKQGACYWYHITIYDTAIEYLKTHPNHPMETLPSPVGSESVREEIYSDCVTEDMDTVSLDTDSVSDSQESLQENLQELPLNVLGKSTGTREADDDQDGGFSKDFNAKEIDVVPTSEIGQVLDSLTEEKGVAKETDRDVDDFAKILFSNPSAVVNWQDYDKIRSLKSRILDVMSAASLDIPPLRFFKFCVEEADNWVADGKLDRRPDSFNFYLNAASGKQIVEYIADKLKSENSAASDKERTDNYLAETRERSQAPVEIPESARKALDEIYGRL